MLSSIRVISALIVAAGFILSPSVVVAEKLTYYCSAQEDWCQLMARAFEKETGIRSI